jgi:ecotin
MKAPYSIAAFAFVAALSSVVGADNMKAFPPAEAGMVRHVLNLPKQEDEDSFKVELVAGKVVEVDQRNRHFFGGKIEARNIEGWGFTRYMVSGLGPMAGTLMAVDPNAPKVKRFVAIGGEPFLVRYNSRLPVVVYAPEGVEVRYRIWSAAPEAKPVEEG